VRTYLFILFIYLFTYLFICGVRNDDVSM
jgi:hypothetical protein